MVVPYDPQSSSLFYRDYYTLQSGNGLSVFKGATVQRGRGIGSFFSKMLRGAMPLLKSGAKTIGKQVIESGANVAKDLINGKDLKSASIKNFSEGGTKLLNKLSDAFSNTHWTNRKRKRVDNAKQVKRRKADNKRQNNQQQSNIFR